MKQHFTQFTMEPEIQIQFWMKKMTSCMVPKSKNNVFQITTLFKRSCDSFVWCISTLHKHWWSSVLVLVRPGDLFTFTFWNSVLVLRHTLSNLVRFEGSLRQTTMSTKLFKIFSNSYHPFSIKSFWIVWDLSNPRTSLKGVGNSFGKVYRTLFSK